MKNFYFLGVKTSVLLLTLFAFANSSTAQSCASVSLGSDVSICSGDQTTLTPVSDFNISGNAVSLADQTGRMSNGSYAVGSANNQGTYFYRGSYNTYTRGVWEMSCEVPSGAEICVRVKVPSGTAMFKVWGVKNWNTSYTSYHDLGTKYVGSCNYKDVCVTSNGDYEYIKVQDLGGSYFYVDAITFSKTCTASYSWSSGQSTSSITVNPTSTTQYIVTATGCNQTVKDTINVTVNSCDTTCSKTVGNTRGCASTPYVIWLKDKNGSAYHLSGDSTKYQWLEMGDSTVKLIAEDISASGLSGTFDIEFTFSGRTTTPPTNSPKYSSCFTVGSVTDWVYFTTTSGTITSTNYGTMSITRKGPSAQMGDGANITEDGFGASGWFDISGGNGFFTTGDFNVMLDEDCQNEESTCNSSVYDPCVIVYGKGSYNNSTTTISINETVSEIKEIVVEGIYKGGQPTAGSFTDNSTTVSWSSSDANAIDNVSGTTDKGYYRATLGASSSVSMSVSNNKDKMHGFVAYVKMKDAFCKDNSTSLSDKRYYVYHNTKTETFTLPTTSDNKTITAVLPIAEMNNDTRTATFTLTAGSLSKSVTINTYDLDRSMTIQKLEIEDVPGSVTSASLEIKSPTSNGDSYISGNASFNWFVPCESTTGKNKIAGTVFFDKNVDTTLSSSEDLQANIRVYLYDDADDDEELDANESTPIDSTWTDGDGNYAFYVDYKCKNSYFDDVTYESSIGNSSNLLGEPGSDYAVIDNNNDNLIVRVQGQIISGNTYDLYLGAIESGAYAIISESTDGTNFYHNTNVQITSSGKDKYTVTSARNVKYIKFDKNTINTISGYNSYGSTSTNSSDYAVYGIDFCKGKNSYLIISDLTTYPDSSFLTTNNVETATFTGTNQQDTSNNYGFSGPVFMDGYVFYDADSSGTFDANEVGTPNVTVYLYPDLDHNGQLSTAEKLLLITSVKTNALGYYSFTRNYVADLLNLPDGLLNSYIITTNESDYPVGSALTTDNQNEAEFNSYDQSDLNNNFGHVRDGSTSAYCGQLEITIDKNKVESSSNLTNFPVYLDLTHNALRYMKNWNLSYDQGIFSPYGHDVLMKDANGDMLPIEIVSYDSAAGNMKLWVLVNTLSVSANTTLTLYHGVSSGAISNPSTDQVWDDYSAVYHFDDLTDATSNANNATNNGASVTSGKLGNSMNFDGNDYLQVSSSSSLNISGKKITMSAWVNIAANPSSDAPFAVKGPSQNQEAYMFGVDGGSNPILINSRVTTDVAHYRDDNGSLASGQWVYVQMVYDGDLSSGQKRIYVDGDLEYTSTATGNIAAGNHDLFIGKRVYSDNRYFTGLLDELRISGSAKSAGWIATEYNNQVNPNSFYTITDSFGCGSLPVTWLDFNVTPVNVNDAVIQWSTASETNNSHFVVERAASGQEFEAVGDIVYGAGNSSQVQNYEAMDFNLTEGVFYYRVKQVDFDGKFDYTPVKAIQINSRNKMTLSPNPANEEVLITFISRKGEEVIIRNVSGQEVERVVLGDNGDVRLNTTDYPSGIYFVTVNGGNSSETKKLIIQK